MSHSLRDQLLGLGFKPAAKPEPPARPKTARTAPAKPEPGAQNQRSASRAERKPAPRSDIDLAKAYAIRAQREKDERMAAEQARQEAARKRREARARLSALLVGKALNDKDADIARHFEYGGKIKRIHVTADQLRALNAGELGVVQDGGRYLLVSAADLAKAEDVFAEAVALKIDPHAPAGEDPYSDPRYQVPDDLIW